MPKNKNYTGVKGKRGETANLVRKLIDAETQTALTDIEIGSKLGVNNSSVKYHRHKLNISAYPARQQRLDRRNARKKGTK